MKAQEILELLKTGDIERAKEMLSKSIDELEDEELKEILEVAEKVAREKGDVELLKMVTYYYAEFFGIDKLKEFEEFAKGKGKEGLFQLADLYSLLGYPERALQIYRDLLEGEEDNETIGEIYYGIATIHDELQEYEKALDAIEKAVDAFKKCGCREKLEQAELYLAYITFENGKIEEAKETLGKLLAETEDSEIKAQVHLVFKEIFEDEENYEAAIHEALYSLLEGGRGEVFDVAFDGFIDLMWQLILEDKFDEIASNMPMFKAALPELGDFFEGIRRIALYRKGEIGREDVSEIIMKIKDERLVSILEFLGEAEL
ncbi:tetratricopeptide repeat protein [Pyrococcus abyssi]|uniref:TRP-repeat-containing protein n=1 Tax=Pyrococcus abyssi (strain GE5 / Orsay) TaxID=272844 RepID=Q9V2A8_PYRAB|nr:tetratricopeptide repeat protein [Pyrococcus abyssi]CAB49090.1 TRP-repeat-containing protein [Pyrococcus abyssi GE5]CCE69542.1 TPA: hypothetical protein PAB2243 [Pyrococcus abyssi GE5]